jgi:threonine/homoserine/homoserine lactone efflux protein
MHIVMSSLLKGMAFGVAMAAVPGPIFFLIVQRTLAEGALLGFLCALGAICADAIYALVAVIGLTFIMQFLLAYQSMLAILGGFFLIYLGITTLFKKVHLRAVTVRDTGLFGAWASTLFLTLANPVTMISYCVMFSALGVGVDDHVGAAFSLVGGVVFGALVVIILLITFLSFFRKRMTARALNILNKIAAVILMGFGVAALAQGVLGASCKLL